MIPAYNRSRTTFAMRKVPSSYLAEIRRRVALRGGTRHVERGALKLRVPQPFATT